MGQVGQFPIKKMCPTFKKETRINSQFQKSGTKWDSWEKLVSEADE